MVINVVYMPPFHAVECTRGNSNGRIVHHRLVWLVMKLVGGSVLQGEGS